MAHTMLDIITSRSTLLLFGSEEEQRWSKRRNSLTLVIEGNRMPKDTGHAVFLLWKVRSMTS